MSFPLILTGTAQGHAVVDEAVIADLSGLADDDAHTVVDDQAAADLGAGMDFDPGPEAAPLGDEPGQEFHMVAVAEVGGMVIKGSMHAGIEKKDLQFGPGSGVTGLIGFQQFTQMGQNSEIGRANFV